MSLACSLWRADMPEVPETHPVDFPRVHQDAVAGVPLWTVPAPVGTAAVGVSLRLGRASDPADRPGLTALLLAAMRGHGERPGSLAAALGELGGAPTVLVADDGALLTTEVPAEHAPAALAALLAAVRRAPADPDELAALAAELAAARERARDDPAALALAAVRRVSFPPGHPHARSDLSARTWSLEHVLEAREQQLGPAALAVIVAGEADARALRSAAAAGLADWSARAPAPPLPGFTPPPAATHLVARPGLPQAVIAIGAAVADSDELPARIAELLVQSALHERLRTRMAATYSVEVGHELARGPGLVHLRTEVDVAAVIPTLDAIDDALAALRRGPIDPEIVARVCALERLEPMFARQTNVALLQAAARLHWFDRPRDHDDRRAARDCATLTPAVTAALRAGFARERLQIVVVGDPGLLAAPLAERGPFTRLEPATL